MAFNIGDTVGDYQIVGVLGEGEWVRSTRCATPSPTARGDESAPPQLAEAPDLAERFMREIKMLASLNHPTSPGCTPRCDPITSSSWSWSTSRGAPWKNACARVPSASGSPPTTCPGSLGAGLRPRAGSGPSRLQASNVIVTPEGQAKLMDSASPRPWPTAAYCGRLHAGLALLHVARAGEGGRHNRRRSDLYSVGVSSTRW